MLLNMLLLQSTLPRISIHCREIHVSVEPGALLAKVQPFLRYNEMSFVCIYCIVDVGIIETVNENHKGSWRDIGASAATVNYILVVN